MQQSLYILNILFPIFAVLAVGFFLAKIKFITPEVQKGLNKIAFYLGLTSMIFLKVSQADINLSVSWRITVSQMITMFVTAGITYLVARSAKYPKSTIGALVQIGYRSNMLYISIPIFAFVLDGAVSDPVKDDLLSNIFLGMTPVMIAYNVLAVIVLTTFSDAHKKLSFSKIVLNIITNPLIIASLLGVFWAYMNWQLPTMVVRTLNVFSGVAFPLALLGIGCTLAQIDDFSLIRKIPIGVFAKLVISPVICFFCATWLGLNDYMILGTVLLVAAPTAISSYIMAEQMQCNPKLTAVAVATSTLLSFVSIAVLLYIFSFNLGIAGN
jgi:predicted permease